MLGVGDMARYFLSSQTNLVSTTHMTANMTCNSVLREYTREPESVP